MSKTTDTSRGIKAAVPASIIPQTAVETNHDIYPQYERLPDVISFQDSEIIPFGSAK